MSLSCASTDEKMRELAVARLTSEISRVKMRGLALLPLRIGSFSPPLDTLSACTSLER
jgi:hypothetical protein